MTQQQYILNRKLNILELGKKLENISEACRRLGVSRQHDYDIKEAVQENGIDGLLEKSRSQPRYRNRVSEQLERALLDCALKEPTHGQVRVENELKKKGIIISAGGIRAVWLRAGIQTMDLRLKRLEKSAAETGAVLTESQVQALEEAKNEKEAHGEIETHCPGFLLGQDTYFVGNIKGVGNIYQQTAIDTFSNVGFAKVYTEKTALVAADMLNDRVLPFFDEYQVPLLRVLTDRGGEYCGKKESHPFELFCHLSDIEHSRTKAYHPQTNGCTEKLNQTIQNEFYKVAFRKKLYGSLEEIQTDLDAFMERYNRDRTNQGKYCQGRTPMETFEQSLELVRNFVPREIAEEKLLETVH
ncbi:MAG: IS481 family transposase [Alphaproteobacteria bacterium]|nr:IS481 family transposase [Alphaproteobacteria bacterium]